MQTNIITTDQVIAPLLELLNDQYPVHPDAPYEIPPFGQFGALEQNPNEIAIELPDGIVGNQAATRAIATLLWRSGSQALRSVSRFTEADPYRTPLRFSYVKRLFSMETDWQWNCYVVADYLDDEVDAAEAERQIRLLVGYLRDPKNLIRLKPDDLTMF
jgi:hypothetical protein